MESVPRVKRAAVEEEAGEMEEEGEGEGERREGVDEEKILPVSEGFLSLS